MMDAFARQNCGILKCLVEMTVSSIEPSKYAAGTCYVAYDGHEHIGRGVDLMIKFNQVIARQAPE